LFSGAADMLVPQAFLPPEALTDSRTIGAAARLAIDAARRGDIARGLAIALHARGQARGLENASGELAALNAAAMVHSLRGDPVAAATSAMDALDLAARLGEEASAAHALVTLSTSALALGLAEDAHRALGRALAAAISARDPSLEVRARVALGIALGDLGEFGAAEREFSRSAELAGRGAGGANPGTLLANLANLHCKRGNRYRDRGRGAEAQLEGMQGEALARNALELAVSEGNRPVQGDARAIIGRARDLQGDPMGAIRDYERAAATARSANCRTRMPWFLLELGRLRLDAGDPVGARQACEEALQVASELRPSAKLSSACALFARIERLAGDEVGARRWERRGDEESVRLEVLRREVRSQLRSCLAG
jgi:tetratricopeptide (TPR) repeat protein